MESNEVSIWKKCSSCKKPIPLGGRYYTCSVSTCNGQRTGYVFCSVPCFEVHLPSARHKDAAAIENKAPMRNEPVRKIIATSSPSPSKPGIPREVLIIASRLKDYIHARADMNTSQQVIDVLSDHVREICDQAIDNARAQGRKTVMDRDFEFLNR